MIENVEPLYAAPDEEDSLEDEPSSKQETAAIGKMPYVSKGKQIDTSKLLQAAKREDFSLANKILSACRELDLDLADEVGKTVIHYLSNYNRKDELVYCLTKMKCDVNKADRLGWSPLHYAAMKGHAPIVQILVKHGANCNVSDEQQGRTPLHYAVSRDNKAVVELLLECGADASIEDKNAKKPSDICKNEMMKTTLEEAIAKAEERREGAMSETLDITLDRPTPFTNIGITVDPKPAHDTNKKDNDSNRSFKMSMKRSTQGSSNIEFEILETEEICSDVFTYKLVGNLPLSLTMELDVPVSGPPEKNEELVMKTDTQTEIIVQEVVEEEEKWTCKVTADVISFSSFVILCRPKQERFLVGKQACNIKSSLDERVEMDIPKGTFDSATTITMEITEPPKTEQLDTVIKECADLKGITSFYSLEAGGLSLQKPITVKVPPPTNYQGTNKLLVFSMDAPLDEEKPEHWKIISAGPQIKQGRIEFDVGSFSVKCACETGSLYGDNISIDFERASSVLSQISRIFRKARRKEYKALFVCFVRRLGTTNTFTIVVECCKGDQLSSRIAFWEGEGFEIQGNGANTEPITIKAKEKFEFVVKSLHVEEGCETIAMEFHPKLDNVQKITVKIPDGQQLSTGGIVISRINPEADENLGDSANEIKTKITMINVKLLKFHPDMLNKIDGRAFLSYTRMLHLQESIGDQWWKVLLLMGVPFQKIDKTLKENPGNVDQKINSMLFDWRESARNERSRGLPLLLMALSKSGHLGLVKDQQIELVKWKNDKGNTNDPFYEWLVMAYKYDLLAPTVYEKPMSDGFLAMLADQINPSIDVAMALNLPEGAVKDMLDKVNIYPAKGLRTMKMLDMFRMGMPDKKTALLEMAKSFKKINLKRQMRYLIMSATAWLKKASAGDAMARDVEQFLQEVSKETGL